jgi:integrase
MQYFAVGHTSKTLVREYEAKLRNQIKEWRMFPDRKLQSATFRQFVDEQYLPKHARRMKTLRDYHSICKKLNREEWANKNLQAIDRHDVEPYLTRRYSEVSISTANREFAILKGIFTKAEEWRYIAKGTNPCKGVKMKKEQPRFRVFSTQEVYALLAQCKAGSGAFRRDEFDG